MSDVSGLYVLVKEVKLEETAGQLPSIKIRGIFLTQLDSNRETESNGPREGWAHFRLPADPDKARFARAEWKDLANAKGKVVALGSAMSLNNSYRVTDLVKDTASDNPEEYPVSHGLALLRDSSRFVQKLKEGR
jgi:hypothetical protein